MLSVCCACATAVEVWLGEPLASAGASRCLRFRLCGPCGLAGPDPQRPTRPAPAFDNSANVKSTLNFTRKVNLAGSASPGRRSTAGQVHVAGKVQTGGQGTRLRLHVRRLFERAGAGRTGLCRIGAGYHRGRQPKSQTSGSAAAGASGSASTPSQTTTATAQPQQTDNTPYVPTTIRPEAPLPTTTPELVAELAKRAQAVGKALDQGDLTGLWYPAIGAKDVALALEENHISEIPRRQAAEDGERGEAIDDGRLADRRSRRSRQ